MSQTVNKAIIVGRIGQDAALRTLPTGTDLCELSIATDHGRTEEARETTWHKVIVFGKPAAALVKLATKGAQVYAEGRISHRKYTDKAGVDRVAFEIIGDKVIVLSARAQTVEDPEPRKLSPSAAQAYRDAKEGNAVAKVQDAARRNIKQPMFSDLPPPAPTDDNATLFGDLADDIPQ